MTVTISCFSDPTTAQTLPKPTPWSDCEPFLEEIHDAAKITIILKNCLKQNLPKDTHTPCQHGHLQGDESNPIRELGALCELLFMIASQDVTETLNVIGLEEIVTETRLKLYMEDVCEAIAGELGILRHPHDCNGFPSVGAFLVFFTHEQCRTEQGEKRYRQLTVQ